MSEATSFTVKYVLSDVAGTVVESNPWKYLVNHPKINRRKRLILSAWAYPAYATMKLKLLSETRFREQWVKGLAGLLEGWSRDEVNSLFEWLIANHTKPKVYQHVVDELLALKAQGATVILVSNMFEDVVQLLANELNLDKGIGSVLAYEGDRCTGQIVGNSCAGPQKLDFVQNYLGTMGQHADFSTDTAGFADSWSDRHLLSEVAVPTAVYPDARLRNHAIANGWRIVNDAH